jgi:hypothetical protein
MSGDAKGPYAAQADDLIIVRDLNSGSLSQWDDTSVESVVGALTKRMKGQNAGSKGFQILEVTVTATTSLVPTVEVARAVAKPRYSAPENTDQEVK